MELESSAQPIVKAKKVYDRTNSCKIAEDVLRQTDPSKGVETRSALDEEVEGLTDATVIAVSRLIPNLSIVQMTTVKTKYKTTSGE
jgi:hypothetical protein